jgi:hypothetical protein
VTTESLFILPSDQLDSEIEALRRMLKASEWIVNSFGPALLTISIGYNAPNICPAFFSPPGRERAGKRGWSTKFSSAYYSPAPAFSRAYHSPAPTILQRLPFSRTIILQLLCGFSPATFFLQILPFMPYSQTPFQCLGCLGRPHYHPHDYLTTSAPTRAVEPLSA